MREDASTYLQDKINTPLEYLSNAADRLNANDPDLRGRIGELTQQVRYLPEYLGQTVDRGGNGDLVPPDLARALTGVQENLNRYGQEHQRHQNYTGKEHPGRAPAHIAQMALEMLNQALGDDALQENVLFPAADRTLPR